MTLPMLFTVAILLPVFLFLALLAFAKGATWLALRPRVWAVVMIVIGVTHAVSGAWNAQDGFDIEAMLFLVGGLLFILGGIYHWFRGRPVDLE